MNQIVEIFRRITSGVYVVGVAGGGRRDAFTAAWLIQASFDPLLLALSINPENTSYEILRGGGGFAVSILRKEQLYLAQHFGIYSGKDHDKLAGIAYRPGRSGAPILADALGYFDCELTGRIRAGDHELVLGRVVDGGLFAPGAVPLTYAETGDMDGSSALYPSSF